MNKTLSRVLWIIAGVLLIVAGVYCFVSPDAALSGLSLILGLAMLFSGIVDIVIFASSRRFMLGSGWFLLDGIFTVLLKQWKLSAWHSMASVAIWSALIYLPIYILFIPKHFQEAEPVHLLVQGVFHGVLVVIIATLTYVAAIERLGAFKTGSIVTLAPFIAAVIAVPLLNEPLSPAIMCGLVGMGIGALQPWRWFCKDALTAQLSQQKQD